jgi:hypothetical protein
VLVLLPALQTRLREQEGADVAGLPDLGSRIARMLAAAATSGVAAFGAYRALSQGPSSVLALFVAIVCGMGGYVLAAQLLGCPEWLEAKARFGGKLIRKLGR